MRFDVDALRAQFPALGRTVDGEAIAYFDGPGGTQVPRRVIDAVVGYYETANANDGGAFETSERSDAIVAEAHAAVADLLGAASGDEIKFGHNMTTLTFHVSRSIAATFSAGDEIVVTTLDHEANVSPWRAIAADRGLVVRTVDIRPDDVTLDLDALDAALTARTRLVAVGYASNAVGTINPVATIVERAHGVGALTYIDAVHYAPHGPIDVRSIGTDFLVTSAYKWFGPHLGALYGRRDILDALPAYKVRPAHDRFETGTQNFEAIAGAGAAVAYLQAIGQTVGSSVSRRDELVRGMDSIRAYERGLAEQMASGLAAIPGVRIWGISDAARFDERTPTFALTIRGVTPRDAAAALGRQAITAWDGDFYAQALIERLGLFESGGVLRLGIVHYTTPEEVDRVLEAIERIAREHRGERTPAEPAAATPA
ncbi:MAG TPA: cysteine desulfurase-like protein [Candidatus Limnocylindrales bacterium]|nr:cysteine desulfurase-like protein [Candidatus Limnocylindrales bacterium]